MTTRQLPQYSHISLQTLDSLKTSILASKDDLVAVDTETTGLKWIEDRAFGVSLAWDDKATFLRNTDYSVVNIGAFLTDLFASNKTFVFHNCEFDLHMIRETYGVEPPQNILDTLRIAALRDAGSHHGLKELSVEEFGPSAAIYETTIKTYMTSYKLKNYSYVPPEFMDPYACMDTVLTKALAYLYKDAVMKDVPQLFELEHRLIPVLIDMEKTGIKVDLEYATILHRQFKGEQRNIQDEIYSIVGRPLEIGSTKQLQLYFYDELKLKPPFTTKGGGRSTNKDALEFLSYGNPGTAGSKVADLVLRWRNLDKIDSTYVQAYRKHEHKGRIHGHWNASGALTGRFTGSEPNLQNIPRDKRVRRLLIPDYEFFDFDYSQIELRLMADKSEQQSMVQTFNDGGDLHAYTASLLYGVSPDQITKEQRQVGKHLNFGAIYGGGSRTLAKQCGIKEHQARYFLRQFWDSYAIMKNWGVEREQEGRRKGYVRTAYGRKVPFKTDNQYKNAANYIIQGSAADIVKYALLKTWWYVKSVGGSIRNTVHDSITFDGIDESHVAPIRELMEDIKGYNLPIKVDMQRSTKSWGDMVDE